MVIENQSLPTNKKFGVCWTVIFFLAALYLYIFHDLIWVVVLLSMCLLTLAITIFSDGLLHPLNKAWMRFGMLLGRVVSPIILGVIFFGIFLPLGFALRLKGRDLLYLNLRASCSHWQKREVDVISAPSFKNQF